MAAHEARPPASISPLARAPLAGGDRAPFYARSISRPSSPEPKIHACSAIPTPRNPTDLLHWHAPTHQHPQTPLLGMVPALIGCRFVRLVPDGLHSKSLNAPRLAALITSHKTALNVHSKCNQCSLKVQTNLSRNTLKPCPKPLSHHQHTRTASTRNFHPTTRTPHVPHEPLIIAYHPTTPGLGN